MSERLTRPPQASDRDDWLASVHATDALTGLNVVAGVLATAAVGGWLLISGETVVGAAILTLAAVFFLGWCLWDRATRLMYSLTRLPCRRLRMMGHNIVATPPGLIVDSRDTTAFVTWQQLADARLNTDHPTQRTDDRFPPMTIETSGAIRHRRRKIRLITRWSSISEEQPQTVRIPLTPVYGSDPEMGSVIAVIGDQCPDLGARIDRVMARRDSSSKPPASGRPAPPRIPPAVDAPHTPLPADQTNQHTDPPARSDRDEWIAEKQISSAGFALAATAVVVAVVVSVGGVFLAFLRLPIGIACVIALFVFLVMISAKRLILLGLRAIRRPPDRVRWAGCHLAVTPDGLILTDRRQTAWLAWADMIDVALQPMRKRQARLIDTPVIMRPTLVGNGTTRRHWFPIRHIRPFRFRAGQRGTVAIDPGVFLEPAELARHLWRHRPDLASLYGVPEPGNLQVTYNFSKGSSVLREFRGTRRVTSDGGIAVLMRIPELGPVSIDYSVDHSTVRVQGEHISSVTVHRNGRRRNAWIPIGSADPGMLTATVDGVPMTVARITRNTLSFNKHQYAVTDGRGDLFMIKPTYLVSGNEMQAFRGLRATEGLHPLVRRLRDGRINVTLAGAIDDERDATDLALTLALSAAFGTRTLQLRNLVWLPLYLFSGLG